MSGVSPSIPAKVKLPDANRIAAFRAYVEGIAPRACIERYAPSELTSGRSARGVLGSIRRELVAAADARHRDDWATLFRRVRPESNTAMRRKANEAMLALPSTPVPSPQLDGAVSRWLPQSIAEPLNNTGVRTWADLAARMSRKVGWWRDIEGIGAQSSKHVSRFIAEHPTLQKQIEIFLSRLQASRPLVWERQTTDADTDSANMNLPLALTRNAKAFDGSSGKLRAPRRGCLLEADNDLQAVEAWLGLQESEATKRAYRKEAERLMLWAIIEREKPLSSLTHEDAVAYRAFLRRPVPASRWIGPVAPRRSREWKPFQAGLSPRSMAYSLSVLSSLFRWLTEQRYLIGNPFAGVNAKATKAAKGNPGTDAQFRNPQQRVFTAKEWATITRLAQHVERKLNWSKVTAIRLRFILTFCVATGVRVNELATIRLRDFERVTSRECWVTVKGKGGKRARVAIPPAAWDALIVYQRHRDIRGSIHQWPVNAFLIAPIDTTETELRTKFESEKGLTPGRIWAILRRFFDEVGEQVSETHPVLHQKLAAASPHWLRHTHATFALDGGADLVTVRDNLRHASVNTTSNYLHTEDRKRALQLSRVFVKPERR
ncbi:MAG: tyrosine-type recombinase/integrase [Burkholderiales bacterium]|nr:tyrosine-type recombinase/integrase [Burkholderiales bacterium]